MNRSFLFCCAAVSAALVVSACAKTYTQADAVTIATQHSCQKFYQRCGQIGTDGGKYTDESHCETDTKAQWNNYWPQSDCDNKINIDAFNTCTAAIDITDCNNLLDFFNTVLDKCSEGRVCSYDGGS